MKKLNINAIAHEQLIAKSTNEPLSLSAILSAAFGFNNIFVTHEILLPGRKDSSPHVHTKKEELIFVLEGNPVLHLGGKIFDLEPGDYIGIPPLTKSHYLENLTNKPVKFFKICSNPDEDIVRFDVLEQLSAESKDLDLDY